MALEISDLTATEDSEFLILAGPEINEPIARYGPFVMNTKKKLLVRLRTTITVHS